MTAIPDLDITIDITPPYPVAEPSSLATGKPHDPVAEPSSLATGKPHDPVAETCDGCPAPGACCRDFGLRGPKGETQFPRGSFPDDPLEEDEVAAIFAAFNPTLPFLPNRRKHVGVVDGETVEIWTFRCPHVTAAGRCGIYEARPQICRDYQPGADAMCALHPEHVPPVLHPADLAPRLVLPEDIDHATVEFLPIEEPDE